MVLKNKFRMALIYAIFILVFTYFWFKLGDPDNKIFKNKFNAALIYSTLSLIFIYLWLKCIDPESNVRFIVDQSGNVTKKITYW